MPIPYRSRRAPSWIENAGYAPDAEIAGPSQRLSMPRIEISIYVAIVCYPGSFAPLGPTVATGRKVKVPPSDISARHRPADFLTAMPERRPSWDCWRSGDIPGDKIGDNCGDNLENRCDLKPLRLSRPGSSACE